MKNIKINSMPNSGNIAEVEITYKTKVKPSEMQKVTSSKDIANILKDVWSDKIEYCEEFIVLCLNRANRVLGWVKISQGGIAGTVCDPKIVFQIALKMNASAIVLSHNHPSGQLKPSDADKQLTKKIISGGNFLEIQVLDHIIITSEGYFSFADDGIL